MLPWEEKLHAVFGTLTPTTPKTPGVVIRRLWELYYDGQDIWTQIKAGSGNYVNSKSLAAAVKKLQPDLDTLGNILTKYISAPVDKKGAIITAAAAHFAAMFKKCIANEDASVQLLPVTLALALLHLSCLREAVVQEKVLFKSTSTPSWKTNLDAQAAQYRKFFSAMYPLWKEWRLEQIATEDTHTEFAHKLDAPYAPPGTEYFRVEDSVVDYIGGRRVNFIAHIYDFSDDPFTSISAQSMKRRLFNDMNAQFMKTYQLTYALHRFLPGKELEPAFADPTSGRVGAGPFSVVLSDGEHLNQYRVDNPDFDKAGTVTGVVIREGGVIDGLQFLYKGYEGHFVGNKQGGLKRVIELKGKHITEIKLGFADYIVNEMEIFFSDGTSSGKLGNWGGMEIEDRFRVSAGGVGKDFQLVSASLNSANSTGGEAWQGIFQAEFNFLHVSLDPQTNVVTPTKATTSFFSA